jgi:sigma-B regulation protein RsbU (phosphoserine phosphatase)
MNVLIVDDAADTRILIRFLLEKRGWHVMEATDGHAACRILENNDIKIVITDWMMPGMDGLSLIEWIRARDKDKYIYTILMTSRDEQGDCVQGFSVGADEYITKPVAPEILYARLGVARRILSIQKELRTQQVNLRKSRDLVTRAYDIVQEDLENAAEVQKSLLPTNGLLSQSIASAWCYRPAMGISGDYLDIFQVGENRLFFYLLDVSGHGVTAALRSSAISQLLRPISGIMDGLEEHGPAHIVQRLNRHLCEANQEVDYFATLVVGDIDAANGILRISSAGHPPPLLLRQGFDAQEIEAGGLPIGIDAGADYSHAEIWLRPQDSLLLYSDGLLDCEDRHGRHYGIEPTRKRAETYTGSDLTELLSQLENDLDQWRTGTPLSDDLSLLLLKFSPDNANLVQDTEDLKVCQNPYFQASPSA